MKASLILALMGVIQVIYGWSLVYFAGDDCSGKVLGYENDLASETSTCSRPTLTSARSARIEDFEYDRFWSSWNERKTIRFYDSDDCFNSCSDKHVLDEGDFGCVTFATDLPAGRKMRSFNVIQKGSVGLMNVVISDGVCILKHGDSLTFKGREWRMQQVAATFFQEIPAELWDDDLHTRNETVRFAQHGDVDMLGKYKFWLQDDEYFREIPLEQWNATKHAKYQKRPSCIVQRYENFVEDICDDPSEELLAENPKIQRLCAENTEPEEKLVDSLEGKAQAILGNIGF